MSIDPEEIENEVANLLQPMDELIAREEAELNHADEEIQEKERKFKKIFPEAKRVFDEFPGES